MGLGFVPVSEPFAAYGFDLIEHLFKPEGDEMRILGGSPMKYFYRREVEDVAYRNTVEKIRTSYDDLQRDFARHGITFRDPEAQIERGIGAAGVSRAQLGIGL